MLRILSIVAVLSQVTTRDIGYSKNSALETAKKLPAEPIYAPDRCPGNQLLYPGVREDDEWVCDCGPGFIYYKPKDDCFKAYRQGPCTKGQHLIWNHNKSLSECLRNPCEEGFAKYKGKCYEMGKPNGPCPPVQQDGGIFNLNTTTLVVECVKGPDRLALVDVPPNCPPGSKRGGNDCRPNYNV